MAYTIEDKYNMMLDVFNLKEYYDKGFKGRGVTIASIEQTNDGHGLMVANTVKTYAPEVKLISYNDCHEYSATGDNGTNIEFPKFADWCIENKVDIITSSLDWSCDKEVEKEAVKRLYDNGIIFFNCAGNAGSERHLGKGTKASNIDVGIIAVSGISINMNKKITWSGFNYGDIVDVVAVGSGLPFKSFFDENDVDYEAWLEKYGHNYAWAGWSGTSAATPFMASMFAVLKSTGYALNSKNAMEEIELSSDKFTYKDRQYNIFRMPDLAMLLRQLEESKGDDNMLAKQHLTDINFTKAENKENKYIVIHYTGNANDTALNNCKYFKSMDRGASANYFVDETSIYQCVDDNNAAWHCGKDYSNGKAPYWTKCTNFNSIGIEMCNSMSYNEKVEANTIDLIKHLMIKYNIPIENVIRHYDVCGKNCPAIYVSDSNKWLEFKKKIAGESEIETAIHKLVSKGIISSGDYWLEHYKDVKYLDILIIKFANNI